jgi:signal transduction histidine kinase
MKTSPDGEETPWIRLSEGLIAGIHHALNNRMAALGGAVQVLQGDIELEHPLISVLSSEIRRLDATASLLRYLSPGDGSFEPVQLSEVLGQSAKLFEIHHALRDLRLNIESPEGLLPVWTAPEGLLRTLMLMLAAVAGGIPRTGSWGGTTESRAIELRVHGDPARVRIVVNVPARLEDADVPAVSREDVEEMAGQIGATFTATDLDRVSRWELELPTLPEARRREREGATG